MRTISTLIVHHSAGPKTASVADIDREHRARGWSGIGYHYLVHHDGGGWRVSPGRPEAEVGAHDQDQNVGSIGICLAGDYTREPMEAEGWRQLVVTLVWLCLRYRLRADQIEGHGEREPAHTPTACPGFDVGLVREAVAVTQAALQGAPFRPGSRLAVLDSARHVRP